MRSEPQGIACLLTTCLLRSHLQRAQRWLCDEDDADDNKGVNAHATTLYVATIVNILRRHQFWVLLGSQRQKA